MRKFFLCSILASAAAAWLAAAPANARGTAAYLANGATGDCTSAPCSSMTTALTAAGIGGEVICLNKGKYGGASITRAVTISCGDGLWEVAPVSDHVGIQLPAEADATIEGLVYDANQTFGTPITVTGAGTLHLRGVRIGGAVASSSHSHGIEFAPTGPATLNVSNSVFYNVGGDSGSDDVCAAIFIKPASGVTASVAIDRSSFEKNGYGIFADGKAGGIVRGAVTDSFVKNSRYNGITVTTTSGLTVLSVINTRVTGNLNGLVASGTPAGLLVGRSTITANGTGLSSADGGVILSYKSNEVNANITADGAFTGTVGTQ